MKKNLLIFSLVLSTTAAAKVLIQFPKIEETVVTEKELNSYKENLTADSTNPLVIELRANPSTEKDVVSEDDRSIASSGSATPSEEKAAEKKEEKPESNHEAKASAKHDEKGEEKHSGVHHEVVGVPPEESLRWLKNGNKRYTRGFLRADGIKRTEASCYCLFM